MRRNEPVTNTRKHFNNNAHKLVSTTNKKGLITEVNEAFVDMSGFSQEELIGQAHNLVRHPSMPQAAFKELWCHCDQGKPWMGAVKNRCKNGDYYWVDAFITPMHENGQIIGYQSVRTNPNEDTVKRAEKLYQQPNGIRSLFKTITGLPLGYKLASIFGTIHVATGVALLLSSLSPLLITSIGLIASIISGLLVGKPWSDAANETKRFLIAVWPEKFIAIVTTNLANFKPHYTF